MTKFSPDFAWLEEYLLIAQTVVPRIRNLKSVRKISPKEKSLCRILGALTKHPAGHYTMTLRMEYNSTVKLYPKPKLKRKKLSKVDILSTFAHEIAHLMHWDHTPQHKMLEAKLTILFMARLAESGYVSEEDEDKNRRRIDAEDIHRRK